MNGRRILAVALLVAACSEAHDAEDAGASMDAARSDGGSVDAGTRDGGTPDAGTPDGGPPDAGRATRCDPARGVECDGDWSDRCVPACAADECCAPQGGAFGCAPRGADGRCPAADIWVDTARIEGQAYVGWRYFADADCALAEACVDAPGWRRLLWFDTWTPNTGTADLYLGPPADHPELFEYSPCHDHHHFESYARYALRDAAGRVVASGHKQAFCLLDFYRYPEEDERGARYTCDDQGIQMGFQDVYGSFLDCQWVDVTDVAPGDYVLRIELNYEGVLLESDYDNNVAEVVVTIADDDVTRPCPPGTAAGAGRSCGLTQEPAVTCAPGETLRVGCSANCGLGACTGNAFLRVCDPSAGTSCAGPFVLAQNDDSGCRAGECSRGGDCCPRVELVCPASGALAVFWGAFDPAEAATCDVAVEAAP